MGCCVLIMEWIMGIKLINVEVIKVKNIDVKYMIEIGV